MVFDQFSNSSQTSYQRLPADSSKLWCCICLPLRRQQSFYSTGFSCCREFKFHYNELLYYRACVSSKAYTVLFAISAKRKRKFTRHATKIVTHRVYNQGAQQFRSNYCSTQAVVRFRRYPLHVQRPRRITRAMHEFLGATLPEQILATNNEATSGVKRRNYCQILIDSSVYVLGTLVLSAVQGIIQKNALFKTSIILHFYMLGRTVLAPADGVQEKRGSSRLQIVLATKRSMKSLVIKLLAPWRFLTFIYPHSSYSLMPSDFDGSPSAWLPRGTAINRNTYGLTNRLYLSRRMLFQVTRKQKNTPASSGIIRRPNKNLPTKQRVLISQKRASA